MREAFGWELTHVAPDRLGDAEGICDDVHATRKRHRQVRAILRLLDRALPRARAVRVLVRDLCRELAARRDADALVKSLDILRLSMDAPDSDRPKFWSARLHLVRPKTPQLSETPKGTLTEKIPNSV